MDLDQSSVPIDLRPINVARVVPEEPHIVQTTATGRNIEGYLPNQAQVVCSPNPTPVYYPVTIADPGGFQGAAYGNLNHGLLNWYPRGLVGMAFGSKPPFQSSSCANLVSLGSNGELKNEGGDGSSSGKKPKFLCSFGGKILPRPGSGILRYVGGHTKLIGFKGNINYDNLAKKMVEIFGQPVNIKYQLPGEDLDALVSIACQEDFDIMMEEYDKNIQSLPDGSAKLRLYLFSTSDADSSALAMLSGLNDNGQKYFEAVNGILDEAGGGVTRKASLDSTASNPNSDLGGTEAVVSPVHVVQGNFVGLQTTGASSPVGNSGEGTSRENTPRAITMGPLSSNATDASVVRVGIPTVASNLQISNTDPELENSILPTMSQKRAIETKQVVPTATHYMLASVPQPQDIKGPNDSMQLLSQLGLLQPSTVGNPAYASQQYQLLENAAGPSPKQFMPAMPGSSNQVFLRPNAVQHMIHPSQVRPDNCPGGVAYPVRMVPLDPRYSAYQMQLPHSMVGGAYGWNISTPNRPVFHEGLASPQQVLYTNKITRLDDCYMCEKALPHAHSDSLAQQLKDGNESPTSDSNRSYHSLQSEINMQTRPSNMVLATGGSGEIFDEESTRGQNKAHIQADNQTTMPLSPLGISKNLDSRPETERTALLMTENLDNTKLPVSQGVVLSGGQTPCSVPISNMLQPCPNIGIIQQYSGPTLFQAKQNAPVNMPTYCDVLLTGNMPSQTLEPLTRESPKETSGKYPGDVRKDDILDMSTDNFRQPNQSTEALRIHNPVNVINTEESDMLGQKPQQKPGKDIFVDRNFNKGNVIFESNLTKPAESLSSSSSEAPYSISEPTESYAMPLQPITGYAIERLSAISARKDDAPQFQFTESVTSNGRAPSSMMLSKIIENVIQGSDELFNNQDPLIAGEDITLPPSKHNSIPAQNEVGIPDPFDDAFLKVNDEVNMELRIEDAIHLPSANMIIDSNLEYGASEELAKQELQAVAEGVATINPHDAPLPFITDLSSDGTKGLASKENQERGERNNDSISQLSPKSQDMKAKLPDKSNLEFPTSDLGHLQIIKNEDLEELSELGSGTFGTVYHGKWRGTDVAIKRINNRCFQGKPSEQERMRDDFWNEAIKLADLHHPNVVAFYGVVLDGPGDSVATVTEYMVNGSLRNALQKNARNLDKRKRILIAMDVAFGMEYLHGKNIVHFDLKSDNLLVNLRDPHRPICKVGDLGLSKVKCHTLISGGVRGTLPWMAPELLNGSSSLVSEKVDVFSFGIVLWELLTGEEPYADLHYGAIIGGIVSNTLRPSVPESCDPEWRSLMERCWSSEPSERPSFTGIANQLRAMASKIPPKK